MRYAFYFVIATALAVAPATAVDRSAGEPLVDFSFDQVDLQNFVKLVSERTGKRFIIDHGVDGKVTVITPRIPASQVYPLFLSILESIGCTVVEDRGTLRVIRLPERGLPVAPLLTTNAVVAQQGLVTRVLALKFVGAAEMQKALVSTVGATSKGGLAAVEATDHLIITDTAANIRRIEAIVREIDQPGASSGTEIVRLKFADAQSLADELSRAIAGTRSQTSAQRARTLRTRLGSGGALAGGKRDPVVVASPRANSLILAGTPVQIDALKGIIGDMDVDSPSGLRAIPLKYLDPEETAALLNKVLSKGASADPKAARPQRMSIEPSVSTHSLIIDAAPRDFERIVALVNDMDSMPHQVLIELVIAEVSLSDDLNLGFQMAALNAPESVNDVVGQGSLLLDESQTSLLNSLQDGLFPDGITFGLARGARMGADGNLVIGFPAAINFDALRRNRDVHILANTTLEAQNNTEASVYIVENIPILTSTIQGTGATRDVIQNIERLDVGIKLTLTPHVTPDLQVTMELNPSIEAIIDTGPAGADFAPTIAKREVSTTVTVANGKTVIISGLIREDSQEIVQRVPILGSIPILGLLFRHTVNIKKKTNLLIFVTPHVVTSAVVAEDMADAWRTRTGINTTNVEIRPVAPRTQ
jgi:general secretion pathway protein D